LNINGTKIDDLSGLEPLVRLRVLDARIAGLGDDDLETVAKFTELRDLGLRGANGITDAGIEKISGLKSLEALWISGTGITDKSLETIASSFPNLRALAVRSNDITDAGVAKLASLQELQELYLEDTAVNNEAIKSLASLPKLTLLGLENSDVSEGLLDILRTYPNLEVVTAGKRILRLPEVAAHPKDSDVEFAFVQATPAFPTGD
jgi:hypothetical protein